MHPHSQFLVYPQLPRAGLGNMLLVWARAILFAHINSFPIVTPAWGQFAIGPYLRGERDKRYYGHLFSRRNYVSRFTYLLASLKKPHVHNNPAISKLELPDLEFQASGYHLFIFNQLPHWSDFFVDLKEHQPIVKDKLLSSIRPSVLAAISKRSAPQIGVHIRMGDFRTLKPGDDFTQLGGVRTPFSWFIRVIDTIREIAGCDVPVTIFSDGRDCELSELLKLPQACRAPTTSALSDMLTLSKSKLLIASSGSTFSYWASYLGQCPTIWHPAHFHGGVFPQDVSQIKFEGGFDPQSTSVPDLLIHNLRSAFKASYSSLK
ncbi:alpha-1,2-fucosyltransferase [Pseudanabaena sp. PCC 6802]|uniref:alpha-1,2-fucosyltransferase n=1 Tax=Pseudanabaena sp. PCC 6802 TaxID=118173 RepID=UPI00034B0DE5|nr:alpha-1,2-fucosyltransferase [Pseudanabaena sp. PCC 6802]